MIIKGTRPVGGLRADRLPASPISLLGAAPVAETGVDSFAPLGRMAGMRKPLPVAWAVFDGIDRMHVAKSYSEAESCAEDIGGEIVPLYRSPRWIPVSERMP
jgi:hypothetical protein